MTKDSKVGSASIYQADDQRTSKNDPKSSEKPYQEGQKNSHDVHDSKDQRSIANRLAATEKHKEQELDKETGPPGDPTQAAMRHGNEPSKGAKIDKELQEEDEAILRKKGDSLAGKKQ